MINGKWFSLLNREDHSSIAGSAVTLYLVELNLGVKSRWFNVKQFGSLGLVPAGLFKRQLYQTGLELCNLIVKVDAASQIEAPQPRCLISKNLISGQKFSFM